MKDIKIELRTTISAEAIHAAINGLAGRTSSLTISEQAVVATPPMSALASRARSAPDHGHAELIYLTAAGKTRTIDVEKSIYKNNIHDIEAFLARRRHRGSWGYALKKAILYARKHGQSAELDFNGSLQIAEQRHTFDPARHTGNY